MDYKTRKLIQIIKEWEAKNLDNFEINGVEKDRATYFYREFNKKFVPLPKGSYQVIDQNGGTYLKITNAEIQAKAIEYQLCYEDTQKSSKYEESFPELEMLVSKYNDVVLDVRNIVSYLKSVGMKSDTLQMTQVMTKLQKNTFWYLNAKDELDAFPIGDLNDKYNSMLEQIKNEAEAKIREVHTALKNDLETWKRTFDTHADGITKGLDKKNQDIVNSLNTLQGTLKNELDTKNQRISEQLNTLHNSLSTVLTNLTETKKQEIQAETNTQVSKIQKSVDNFIEANKEKLRGKGITSITATSENITIHYQDDKQVVFTIPTVGGKEIKEMGTIVKSLQNTKLDTGHLNARQTNNANSDQGTGVSTLYLAYGAEGKPDMLDGALLTLAYSSNWYYQLAGDWRTGNLFVRGSNENPSSPLPWNKVYHTGNFNPDSKLNTTGGTVTGDIHMQGSIFSKNNQKIIGSYNYGFSLYDANWIPKYLAYISTDGKISLGYSADGLDIDVKTKLTVKGQDVALLEGNYDRQQIGGAYSGDGGKQPPSYVGAGKVRFLMSNEEIKGDGNYKDFLFMDTYAGGDVPFTTAFGISKNSGRIRSFLMKGAKNGSTWTEKEEVYHTGNFNPGNYSPRRGGEDFAGFHYSGGRMHYYIDNSTYRALWDTGNFNPATKLDTNFLRKVWSGSAGMNTNVCTLPSDWKVVFVRYHYAAGANFLDVLFRSGSLKGQVSEVNTSNVLRNISENPFDATCTEVYVMTGVSL